MLEREPIERELRAVWSGSCRPRRVNESESPSEECLPLKPPSEEGLTSPRLLCGRWGSLGDFLAEAMSNLQMLELLEDLRSSEPMAKLASARKRFATLGRTESGREKGAPASWSGWPCWHSRIMPLSQSESRQMRSARGRSCSDRCLL